MDTWPVLVVASSFSSLSMLSTITPSGAAAVTLTIVNSRMLSGALSGSSNTPDQPTLSTRYLENSWSSSSAPISGRTSLTDACATDGGVSSATKSREQVGTLLSPHMLVSYVITRYELPRLRPSPDRRMSTVELTFSGRG